MIEKVIITKTNYHYTNYKLQKTPCHMEIKSIISCLFNYNPFFAPLSWIIISGPHVTYVELDFAIEFVTDIHMISNVLTTKPNLLTHLPTYLSKIIDLLR
jgi:hypothetical protein